MLFLIKKKYFLCNLFLNVTYVPPLRQLSFLKDVNYLSLFSPDSTRIWTDHISQSNQFLCQ